MKEDTAMMKRFGERLRELRVGSKKRLKDLADAMDCSVVYASDVELGRRTPPSTEKILKIARFLKTDPKELLNLADSARKRIELDLNDSKPKHAKAALLLARSWENLTDDEVERLEQDLESILNRRGGRMKVDRDKASALREILDAALQQEARADAFVEELRKIATANFENAVEFRAWAQNGARFRLDSPVMFGKPDEGIERPRITRDEAISRMEEAKDENARLKFALSWYQSGMHAAARSSR